MNLTLPQSVALIINTLESQGFEAYAVGGCVRDSLLGKTPHDWDITTIALPEQIKACFKAYRIIETGIRHGTLTILIDQMPFEVTTYRVDGSYSDGRRPDQVNFTAEITADLSRRDFTINALAYHPQRGLLDPFNGYQDLQAKLIRCVGDPQLRFTEDALRILRAVRFAATLDFKLESATATALKACLPKLKQLAAERINVEFNQMLCGPYAATVLNHYRKVIAEFIPETIPTFKFEQHNPYHCYNVWEHILHSLGESPPELIIRLALFFHDIGKPLCYQENEAGIGRSPGHAQISANLARQVMTRLRYDHQTIDTVSELVFHHASDIIANSKSIKRWLNRLGEVQFNRLLTIRKADIKSQTPQYAAERLEKVALAENIAKEIIAQQQCFQLKDLAVNGGDLIALGIPQGEQIGTILKQLLELVLNEQINNEKDQLLTAAEHLNKKLGLKG